MRGAWLMTVYRTILTVYVEPLESYDTILMYKDMKAQ